MIFGQWHIGSTLASSSQGQGVESPHLGWRDKRCYCYLLISTSILEITITNKLTVQNVGPYLNAPFGERYTDDYLLYKAGNTKGGSITVPLTSCLTSLD